MPDQDRLPDFELREQLRQDLDRLDVHVIHGARLAQHVGLAVAVARIDYGRAAGRQSRIPRKIAPHRDRPEPLVEEHERACSRAGSCDPLDFELAAPDCDEEGIGLR